MGQIAVSRTVDAPVDVVWAALADLESHPTWMKDALHLEFTTHQNRGVGTVMNVKTRIGPFTTLDVLEITRWVEGESIDVTHRGVITGNGTLGVENRSGNTVVSWVEELVFPWCLGGGLTAWIARPVLAAVWRGNLRRLEETIVNRQ